MVHSVYVDLCFFYDKVEVTRTVECVVMCQCQNVYRQSPDGDGNFKKSYVGCL